MFAPYLVVSFNTPLYDLTLGTVLTVYMINIGEKVEGSFVETRKGAGRARGYLAEIGDGALLCLEWSWREWMDVALRLRIRW